MYTSTCNYTVYLVETVSHAQGQKNSRLTCYQKSEHKSVNASILWTHKSFSLDGIKIKL